MILLHGILHVTIFEATSLLTPNRDSEDAPRFARKSNFCCGTKKTTLSTRRWGRKFSWIKRASFCCPKLLEGIQSTVFGKESAKVYATIDIEKARVGRTRLITNEPDNPRWYESFRIYCAHMAANIIFTVKFDDPVGATLIGRARLPVEDIIDGYEVDQWLEILHENLNPVEGARIHVQVRYVDVSRDADNWSRGIPSSDYLGVPHTYFGQHHSCRVTLYQDAHIADDFMRSQNSIGYEPRRCWLDIFDAITNAQCFIYIAGWSVFPDITLVRDPNSAKNRQQTLGELLKMKASQGVRVLMLVWDDRTSVSIGQLKRDGVMATHDQDTANYFRGSGVHCVLCPRNPDVGESYVQDLQVSTMFTHHQKLVVVDTGEVSPPERSQSLKGFHGRRTRMMSIASFIGGIDLCDGRYDTQQHSLFRTLGTTHYSDFHQPNFPGASIKKGGPREPWHDIHCKLEGPVAWDVLYNFEQRWRKQGSGDNLLLQLSMPSDAPVESPPQSEAWNVQLFRSIDGGAAYGFPESPEEAARLGLISGKDHIIDRSIQDAYINAIRRAKNFIYIENQYFLGSSYGWKAGEGVKVEDIGALHLIPKELSLKIVSKIEAGERFTVYIVIPMWPEGVPESASVQAILDWQRRTMEMMYADIALALRAKGISWVNPKDYLTFFCLGNREARKGAEYRPEEQPEPDTDYSRAQQARRFMIYVHAKMMIVDDEYILIGSANINQRSMDGGRDTEIAMGAYQPNHLATWGRPEGEIHKFRMSLWSEHLGTLDEVFSRPESLTCVQTVNRVAERHWQLYARDVLDSDLPGHLLSYPIRVMDEGEIAALPGMEFFPDTKAKVLGTKSDLLPPILTT